MGFFSDLWVRFHAKEIPTPLNSNDKEKENAEMTTRILRALKAPFMIEDVIRNVLQKYSLQDKHLLLLSLQSTSISPLEFTTLLSNPETLQWIDLWQLFDFYFPITVIDTNINNNRVGMLSDADNEWILQFTDANGLALLLDAVRYQLYRLQSPRCTKEDGIKLDQLIYSIILTLDNDTNACSDFVQDNYAVRCFLQCLEFVSTPTRAHILMALVSVAMISKLHAIGVMQPLVMFCLPSQSFFQELIKEMRSGNCFEFTLAYVTFVNTLIALQTNSKERASVRKQYLDEVSLQYLFNLENSYPEVALKVQLEVLRDELRNDGKLLRSITQRGTSRSNSISSAISSPTATPTSSRSPSPTRRTRSEQSTRSFKNYTKIVNGKQELLDVHPSKGSRIQHNDAQFTNSSSRFSTTSIKPILYLEESITESDEDDCDNTWTTLLATSAKLEREIKKQKLQTKTTFASSNYAPKRRNSIANNNSSSNSSSKICSTVATSSSAGTFTNLKQPPVPPSDRDPTRPNMKQVDLSQNNAKNTIWKAVDPYAWKKQIDPQLLLQNFSIETEDDVKKSIDAINTTLISPYTKNPTRGRDIMFVMDKFTNISTPELVRAIKLGEYNKFTSNEVEFLFILCPVTNTNSLKYPQEPYLLASMTVEESSADSFMKQIYAIPHLREHIEILKLLIEIPQQLEALQEVLPILLKSVGEFKKSKRILRLLYALLSSTMPFTNCYCIRETILAVTNFVNNPQKLATGFPVNDLLNLIEVKSQLSKDKSLLHVIIEMIDKSDRDVLSFASDLPTLNAAASEINEFNTTMWQTNANLEALQFIIDCTDAQHTAHDILPSMLTVFGLIEKQWNAIQEQIKELAFVPRTPNSHGEFFLLWKAFIGVFNVCSNYIQDVKARENFNAQAHKKASKQKELTHRLAEDLRKSGVRISVKSDANRPKHKRNSSLQLDKTLISSNSNMQRQGSLEDVASTLLISRDAFQQIRNFR